MWRDRQIRDRCELFFEPFFPLLCCQCHGWYGIFSFITLDSHCPLLSYRLSSHLYLCGRAEKMAWCFSQKLVVWRPSGKDSCTGALAVSAVMDHRTTGTLKPCPRLNHQLLRLGDLADACLLHIATLQPNLSGPVTAMQKTRISSPDTLFTCHPQWMEK